MDDSQIRSLLRETERDEIAIDRILLVSKQKKFCFQEIVFGQNVKLDSLVLILQGSISLSKDVKASVDECLSQTAADRRSRERKHRHSKIYLHSISQGHFLGAHELAFSKRTKVSAISSCQTGETICLMIPRQETPLVHKVLLKQFALSSQISYKSFQECAIRLKPRCYNAGEMIIRQGDVGTKYCLIAEGSVIVLSTSDCLPPFEDCKILEDMRQHFSFNELCKIPRLGTFGEHSLLSSFTADERDRSTPNDKTLETTNACVFANTDVDVLYLEKEDFLDILSRRTSLLQLISSNDKTRHDTHLKKRQVSDEGRLESAVSERLKQPTNRKVKVRRKSQVTKLRDNVMKINEYIVKESLGTGSYGEVYQVVKKNEVYAMKIIKKSMMLRKDRFRLVRNSSGMMGDVKREVAIMKTLNHENIIKLFEVIDDPKAKNMYMILEYAGAGSLEALLGKCEMGRSRSIFRGITKGVGYLHCNGIVHRDLKPENILLNALGVVKIADFGVSQILRDGVHVKVKGTPAYMSPELFLRDDEHSDHWAGSLTGENNKQSKRAMITESFVSSDVWAMGCILYALLVGYPPYGADKLDEIQFREKLFHDPLNIPTNLNDIHLKDLLVGLLQKNYKQRYSMKAIMTHEWLTEEGLFPLFRNTRELDFYSTVLMNPKEPTREEISFAITLRIVHHLKIWKKRALSNVKEREEQTDRKGPTSVLFKCFPKLKSLFKGRKYKIHPKVALSLAEEQVDEKKMPDVPKPGNLTVVASDENIEIPNSREAGQKEHTVENGHVQNDYATTNSDSASASDLDSDSDYGSVEDILDGDDAIDSIFALSDDATVGGVSVHEPSEQLNNTMRMKSSASSVDIQRKMSSNLRLLQKNSNVNLGISYGMHSERGRPLYQEDCIVAIPDLRVKKNENGQHAYFAVFDGHGGQDVSQFLSNNFHVRLAAMFDPNVDEGISETFVSLDKEILENFLDKIPDNSINDLCSPSNSRRSISPYSLLDSSGSTGTILMVGQISGSKSLLLKLSWVGDSRAVLCKNGNAIALTTDHRVSNESERERIEKLEGHDTANGRLDGSLMITRGFGDLRHKLNFVSTVAKDKYNVAMATIQEAMTSPSTTQEKRKGLSNAVQRDALICTPSVSNTQTQDEDEFIMLASDGLFDVMTNQNAVNIVRSHLENSGKLNDAAEAVTNAAVELGSTDNVSVVIVAFNLSLTPLDNK